MLKWRVILMKFDSFLCVFCVLLSCWLFCWFRMELKLCAMSSFLLCNHTPVTSDPRKGCSTISHVRPPFLSPLLCLLSLFFDLCFFGCILLLPCLYSHRFCTFMLLCSFSLCPFLSSSSLEYRRKLISVGVTRRRARRFSGRTAMLYVRAR